MDKPEPEEPLSVLMTVFFNVSMNQCVCLVEDDMGARPFAQAETRHSPVILLRFNITLR